jgi:NADH dehydrogenase
MSPVHVLDVADAFAAALEGPETEGKTYCLGGPEEVSWDEMLRRIAAAAGKDKIILPMPLAVMKLGAALFDWLPFFPVTRDQLTMLAEGNTAGSRELEHLIGRAPHSFSADNLEHIRS